MARKPKIRLKRIYETPSPEDGLRVLVDRLWPRGVGKNDAKLDLWAKQLAPSHDLRKWFGHDPEKFNEFARRYKKELAERQEDAQSLLEQAGGGTLTLLFAAKDEQHNQAVVLKGWLEGNVK